jgi:hypothetical protein
LTSLVILVQVFLVRLLQNELLGIARLSIYFSLGAHLSINQDLRLNVKDQNPILYIDVDDSIEHLDLAHVLDLRLVVHEVNASQFRALRGLKVAFLSFFDDRKVLADPTEMFNIKNLAVVQDGVIVHEVLQTVICGVLQVIVVETCLRIDIETLLVVFYDALLVLIVGNGDRSLAQDRLGVVILGQLGN